MPTDDANQGRDETRPIARPRRLTRRRVLKWTAAGIAAAAAGGALYAWRVEPHWVRVVRRSLPIAHLPEPMVGRKLIQLSDLHAGPVVDDDYLRRALDKASGLGADLIAITGDFMTCAPNDEIDRTMDILGHLRPAPLGTVAVLGNHDYGPDWQQIDIADALAARLAEAGIRVLRNELIRIGGLQIVGLADLWSPRFAPQKVMGKIDPAQAALVLCHNPDAADRAGWGDYRGWILSGHTHGGQFKPPFLRPPVLPMRNKRYVAGRIDLHDGRRLYINCGLGYVRRIRFNVRPEITLFTLSRLRLSLPAPTA